MSTPPPASGSPPLTAWPTTAGLDKLLGREEVDVVCVCVPSGLHAEIGLAAARAGKHLVVEKPIDITREAARELIDGAAGRRGQPQRHQPAALQPGRPPGQGAPGGGGPGPGGRGVGQRALVPQPGLLRQRRLAGHLVAGRRRGVHEPGSALRRPALLAVRAAAGERGHLRHPRPRHRGGGHRPGPAPLRGRGGGDARGQHDGLPRAVPSCSGSTAPGAAWCWRTALWCASISKATSRCWPRRSTAPSPCPPATGRSWPTSCPPCADGRPPPVSGEDGYRALGLVLDVYRWPAGAAGR